MAKADIKASSKGISTSADRESGSEPKWERSTRKRLSAERSLRTSPGARAMVSHFLNPSGKMGGSGEHYAGWIRDMGDQKQRLFKEKTPGRELLRCCTTLEPLRPGVLTPQFPGRSRPTRDLTTADNSRNVACGGTMFAEFANAQLTLHRIADHQTAVNQLAASPAGHP